MPKTHFSQVIQTKDRTVTTTLCNRMTCHGDIEASQFRSDVTCKFCLRLLNAQEVAA